MNEPTEKKNAGVMVKKLAEFYAQKGQRDKPILVRASRPYLPKFFKPEKRGGVLKCGDHELHLSISQHKKPDLDLTADAFQ